ncbi:ribonuclease PH [bacterium]|nr:ribonuclease PH [bacterium]
MRKMSFQIGFLENPYASVLVSLGRTKVLISVSLEEKTPHHVADDKGWLTAEYSLLPGSTTPRARRERPCVSGRTAEIQRLIGRTLRMAVDRTLFPGLTLKIDADVLQADGGTRTTAINGAMCALWLAGERLKAEGRVEKTPVVRWIGAVSAGVVDDAIVVDLDYEKDSKAGSDCNFVFDDAGGIIEVQGSAEQAPITRAEMSELTERAWSTVDTLFSEMKEIVGSKR